MANPTLYRPGIYCINHFPSGLIYVGAALDIGRRWNVHRYGLRKGRHHSARMQELWDRDGKESFSIVVIEDVTSANELLAREQHWLDRLTPCNPAIGLNTLPFAHSTYGRQISPETREKLAAASRGRKQPPEEVAARAAALRGKKRSAAICLAIGLRRKGKKASAEARAKMSAAAIGRVVSEETKAKLSKANKGRILSQEQRKRMKGFQGTHSAETRAKVSLAKRGIPQSTESVARRAASNKGKKRTPESRLKISRALKGKPLSSDHRAKLSAGQRRRYGRQTRSDGRQLILL